MIGFLFKSAFWLSIALLFIPLAPSSETGERQVGAVEAFFAAREALADLTGICERKPEVCEIGGQFIGSMGLRAREGARMAYEALDGQFGAPEAESVLAMPTEGIPAEGTAAVVLDESVQTGSVVRQQPATF